MGTKPFAALNAYACNHRLDEAALNRLAADYLVADPSERNCIETRVMAGACWLALAKARARAIHSSLWELQADQAQAGIMAIIPSLRSYNPQRTGKSFFDRLDSNLTEAMELEYVRRLSVVTRFVVDGTRQPDVPINTISGRAQAISGHDEEGIDLPDPSGSVLDGLLTEQLAAAEPTPERTRDAVVAFFEMPLSERKAIAHRAGMATNAFDIASCRLRRDHKIPVRAIAAPNRLALDQPLREMFRAKRQASGLTMAQVIGQLKLVFTERGIKASAASAYTLLHAATPSHNQTHIRRDCVEALSAVYERPPLPLQDTDHAYCFSPRLTQYFLALGLRKGVSWADIEEALPPDLRACRLRDAAGIPCSTRVKESLAQRRALYSAYPDVNLLPQDREFVHLQTALVEHKIMASDFDGLLRDFNDRSALARSQTYFLNLIHSRGTIPVALARHCLAALAR